MITIFLIVTLLVVVAVIYTVYDLSKYEGMELTTKEKNVLKIMIFALVVAWIRGLLYAILNI